MSKFNNETLNPGEHFIYNGIEFICLVIIDGNYLAMTAKPYVEIPFDTNGENDWRKSSLRRVLNNDFLDLLGRRHLIKQTSDLIADNGDKAYGTSEDYVTILSCISIANIAKSSIFSGNGCGRLLRGVAPSTAKSVKTFV